MRWNVLIMLICCCAPSNLAVCVLRDVCLAAVSFRFNFPHITHQFWCKIEFQINRPKQARTNISVLIDIWIKQSTQQISNKRNAPKHFTTSIFLLDKIVDAAKEEEATRITHFTRRICCWSFSPNSLINTDLTSCRSCAQIILGAVIHLKSCVVCAPFFAQICSVQFLFYVIKFCLLGRVSIFCSTYCFSCLCINAKRERKGTRRKRRSKKWCHNW